MILYLDTSSLVKLYVTESYSRLVRGWSEEAEILATCRVAYPEMISALNRRFRAGELEKGDYDRLMIIFASEWGHFAVIDFDEFEAGRLAEAYGLRGFDAVHLSACKLLRSSEGAPSVAFSSLDKKLNDAAAAEKLTVLLPKEIR
ncbi:MAG: type II toxin-antitoxin system VapC family toxin [Acidobacteriota bacterium]|jgi:predicted nucleic acid-binding protein